MFRLFFKVILTGCLSISTPATAGPTLPLIGEIDVDVIPCLFDGASVSEEDMQTYMDAVQSVADIFNAQSGGAFNLSAKQRPSVNLTRSFQDTFDNSISVTPIAKDCRAGADANGTTATDHSIRYFLTLPGYGTNAFIEESDFIYGGTNDKSDTLASDLSNLKYKDSINGLFFGGMVHEMGHALGLPHTNGAANDITALNANSVYGGKYASMGSNGPFLTAYDRLLLGSVPRSRLFVMGQNGLQDCVREPVVTRWKEEPCIKTITLHDPNQSDSGYAIALLPFNTEDPENYILVEYSSGKTSFPGFSLPPTLLIYAHNRGNAYFDPWNKPNPGYAEAELPLKAPLRNVLLFDTQAYTKLGTPLTKLDAGRIRIEMIENGADGNSARVTIRSYTALQCAYGHAYRNAWKGDRHCVTEERRDEVRQVLSTAPEMDAAGRCADGNRLLNLISGKCVSPAFLAWIRWEQKFNFTLAEAVAGGVNTCEEGYTFRAATPIDWVCVTEAREREVFRENAFARRHTNQDGSCKSGFVYRSATMGDKVCVTVQSRSLAKEENNTRRDRYRYR